LPDLASEDKSRVIQSDVSMDDVAKCVAMVYKTGVKDIRKVEKGPNKGNEARKMAMYLCQELTGEKHKVIASYFNLQHIGSVSYITCQIRALKAENNEIKRKIEKFIRVLLKN